MKASNCSTWVYGLGSLFLLLAVVAFVSAPLQDSDAASDTRGAFLQRTPPPTATEAGTPNLTATLYFTQTQTAVARTATAAATQTAIAATQTAAWNTAVAQTATFAARTATSAAQTSAARTAAAQTATAAAQTALPATQTALAATQTALAQTATATVAQPTITPFYTITPLGGGTIVTAAPTITPTSSSALPATGLPLTWIVLGGALVLIAVGARYLRASSGR